MKFQFIDENIKELKSLSLTERRKIFLEAVKKSYKDVRFWLSIISSFFVLIISINVEKIMDREMLFPLFSAWLIFVWIVQRFIIKQYIKKYLQNHSHFTSNKKHC